MIFVILSPVGPYYKTGFAAVSLLADPSMVRAWPGGAGGYKVGGNYAPTILTQMKAASEGFQQILWLLPVPLYFMISFDISSWIGAAKGWD